MEEMRESIRICFQILNKIPSGPIKSNNLKIVSNSRKQMKKGMEYLINHFKLYSQGFYFKSHEDYIAIEAPKGEFGIYFIN